MNVEVVVAGSIAAYRSPDFIKDVMADGHRVSVSLTNAARELVSARVIESFVGTAPRDADTRGPYAVDAVVVFAATADLLVRWSQGLTDTPLLETLLSFRGPVIVVPAMNPDMWNHESVREAAAKMKSWGVRFVGPEIGRVACGEEGRGHLARTADILEELNALGDAELPDLSGQRIVVSLGAMETRIDPARRLTNSSSGRMGLALARALRRAGAHVSLLRGIVDPGVAADTASFDEILFRGPDDYRRGLELLAPKAHAFISVAAVLDFEIVESARKLSRQDIEAKPTLDLPKRVVPDFARFARDLLPAKAKLVVFALESGDEFAARDRALAKMKAKQADIVVMNLAGPESGPNVARNRLHVFKKEKPDHPAVIGPLEKSRLGGPLVSALFA